MLTVADRLPDGCLEAFLTEEFLALFSGDLHATVGEHAQHVTGAQVMGLRLDQ